MIEFFLSHGQAITDDQVQRYMAENNVILPKEYISFLKEVNGGEPKNKAFELAKFDIEKKSLDYYVDIDSFFSLDRLVKVWEYTEEYFNDFQLFPIAEVRGGMVICCKQGNSINAELFFYEDNSGITKLTDTLLEFLNLLIPESEVDFKKYNIDY